MKNYDHKKIEKKWQSEWIKKKTYQAKGSKGEKFYSLMEFPYPSGDGLHVGHVRGYTAMDIISRKKRMEGKNVLFPIGWDAFGLPTENYAIKTGKQPSVITKKNTDNFRKQFNSLGMSFDWLREINTTDPNYYKWTQWLFLQFLKKGLAYKAKSEINWCPKDKIGLANEEVIDGKCERCGTPTVKKEKEQWMLGITKYAERLDKDLDLVDFPERVKSSQRNWIGKSEGSEIDFNLVSSKQDQAKNCLIVHGLMGNSKENWFPWLKERLENNDWKVSTPNLPKADHPSVLEWDGTLKKKLKENSVVIGHSLGGPAVLNLIQNSNKKVEKLILVAPVNPLQNWEQLKKKFNFADWDACKKFADIKFDWEKISKLANEIIIYYSDDDKFIPLDSIEYFKKNLPKTNFKLRKGMGHFNASRNLFEFPEILDDIFPKIKVFTTRADTLFGATYVVLAPEHELVRNLKSQITNLEEVERYINDVKKKSDLERTENKEKTGVELKGIKAINPANNEEIPIYIADYVLTGYGTGAIMAVPQHDARDREFAEKYNLPIIDKPLVDAEEITKKVGGKMVTKFKLRDWVFSRQRYWGEPIPVVSCEKCGLVPVKEKDLPVKLPPVKSYKPTDNGESPLASISKWVNTKCPKCGGKAKRETDTMPNWAGSSWYYLRYTDPKNKKEFASKKNLKYWTPVDWYNGGMEHTTLHLLYSRFWHKFFYDLKLVPTIEPYMKRTSHGMILGEGGVKMSKSLGNVVNPDEIVKTYGADTLRVYEMFVGPFEDTAVWNTESIIGSRRFIEKVWRIGEKVMVKPKKNFRKYALGVSGQGTHFSENSLSASLEKLLNKTIKKVEEDIEIMRFNTAISAMMILATEMEKVEFIEKDNFKKFLKILAPFAPHITEDIWQKLGEKKTIHKSEWPKWDKNKVTDDEIKIAVQVNGKIRSEILITMNENEEEIKKKAMLDEKISKFVLGKEVKKIIYVKNRIVNIVI